MPKRPFGAEISGNRQKKKKKRKEKKRKEKELKDIVRDGICAEVSAGKSLTKVAKDYGISESTVRYTDTLQRVQTHTKVASLPR